MLRLALAVLHNVARWRELVPAVLDAPDCVAVLSERLQMFRDMEVCACVMCVCTFVCCVCECLCTLGNSTMPGAGGWLVSARDPL